MKYMLVATLTEYCSCDVYTGLLEPIRHSNIAPMGLSNEAGLWVDCGGISPYNSQANGKIKRTQRTYLKAIWKVVQGDTGQWPSWLGYALWADRTTVKNGDYVKGELVLVYDKALDNQMSGKGALRWRGPYAIVARRLSGAYVLQELDGAILKQPAAWKQLKSYVPRQGLEPAILPL